MRGTTVELALDSGSGAVLCFSFAAAVHTPESGEANLQEGGRSGETAGSAPDLLTS